MTLANVDLNVVHRFVIIADAGSMGKAARQLHVSQSTLTRQIQALESEIGAPLFERSEHGVLLTPAGHVFRDGIQPHLAAINCLILTVRQAERGHHGSLRIGYIASAAQRYLNPALRLIRSGSAPLKLTLLDMTPAEQLTGLRKGELDVGLVGLATRAIEREFYARKLVTTPAVALLPDTHPLAKRPRASVHELRAETFLTVPEEDAPGYDEWVRSICRKAGFRPRFGDAAQSLSHAAALIAAGNVVALAPQFTVEIPPPGVHALALEEAYATADLVVAWRRGRLTEPLRRILNALFPKYRES